MRFARITAIFGGILLAAALAGEASAADGDFKEAFHTRTADASPLAPLQDLEKLRARGPGEEREPSPRVREAIGPILLIFLLQQNRFSDGLDILQPVSPR
jgi:hypothetical protein